MFKYRASTLIAFSGALWLGIGFYLMSLGLNFLMESLNVAYQGQVGPLLSLLSPIATLDQSIVLLVTLGLSIGFVKGKVILARTVRKTVERILQFSAPIPFWKIYSIKYCLLLGLMIVLGVSFKLLGFSFDARGLIDVAIGSALINGSLHYFRQALATRKQESVATCDT
ncbi:MAG: hypothetical protein ACSNEK_08400 [Parachlamydiaceae bacterium]